MGRDLSFGSFLRDLGLRLGAAAVVLGVFVGLGYVNRTNLFGLSRLLGSQVVFFAVAFLVIGLVSICWIVFQQSRE
ncbi:hypothetical protein [Halobacterium sp. CBA1126]|uniref:hypothetical protein n=1 Tax=Halobacterium TaxID=2239 RepID=UPI0012FCD399|nr:hypothetical protein [Halobacterium sp. CBA1126]MUV59627.1 hypothetical protein [Halobacterium sp. CBA1126]